ncbi:origin recognition complex subunit 2 [Lepisosteus oculatus]|uniref:Origin recognition complex subunit 2 n=1 Tax=Lepisosteus oculatus TaxID=7918 RepID=W5MUG4_LEPOC|nr:PREDICTED: origin recognition complex subunit 2 isoform X1 [Lepisosteus oculatus]XP_015214580.1 PREDICTED: origin recognition complex subunit 2 isoform X1 [Lepisosteus oculatus]
MSPNKRSKEANLLEVRFVGDEDVLDHIVDKQEGFKAPKHAAQKLVTLRSEKGKQVEEETEEDVFNQQDYVEVLGTGAEDEVGNGSSGTGGADVFTFQACKRSNQMAQLASELARTPGKSVKFTTPDSPEEVISPSRTSTKHENQNKTPSKGKNVRFISTTPHRLRKRLSAPNLKSDSDSEYSPSNSEEDDEEERIEKSDNVDMEPKTPRKALAAALHKTPAKKNKKGPEPNLVEEYFEAHSSSKVLTSDRTLQKLQTPKLDQETLCRLLEGKTFNFSDEINQLNMEHEKHFSKWILQLQLGFSIVLYGLGSKKALLEKFRTCMLMNSVHLVINGFFPSITLKSILNSITEDVLGYQGSFRTPLAQTDFIVKALKEGKEGICKEVDFHLYLIIHNIDGLMLRGEKTQQTLAQLAAIPNLHLIASIDHINAPLIWDQSKMSLFNWLWYETTTYLPYVEETSYENSLLVQQSGAIALSSLTHVMRSLTPNARGIFRLLAEFQLENKDNPSYTGLSFQDFYQRCREAFLVNSDITLRTQLTEFKDHKLIRTKKGVDGVEYLIISIDTGTLTDFLEKEDTD